MYQDTRDISVEVVRALNERGGIKKHFDGPMKDTVILPTQGFTVYRFVADNPGEFLSSTLGKKVCWTLQKTAEILNWTALIFVADMQWISEFFYGRL